MDDRIGNVEDDKAKEYLRKMQRGNLTKDFVKADNIPKLTARKLTGKAPHRSGYLFSSVRLARGYLFPAIPKNLLVRNGDNSPFFGTVDGGFGIGTRLIVRNRRRQDKYAWMYYMLLETEREKRKLAQNAIPLKLFKFYVVPKIPITPRGERCSWQGMRGLISTSIRFVLAGALEASWLRLAAPGPAGDRIRQLCGFGRMHNEGWERETVDKGQRVAETGLARFWKRERVY